MDQTVTDNLPSSSAARRPEAGPSPEQRVREIASLLRSLDETAANSGRSATKPNRHENHLAQVRLGIASSLFAALRSKHAPTAGHSMRVAIGCSAWTQAMKMPDNERDCLEVAALLHDVGKIGIPDHILQKPSSLSPDEMAIMEHYPKLGVEILGCSAPPEMLDVIKYASAWYNGSKPGYDKKGKDIPLGARILAIVDAFDAMTTDHVYRRAMSRERALVELFEYSGKQFDPELIRQFSDLHEKCHIDLHARVSQRWLEALAPDMANQQFKLNPTSVKTEQLMSQTLFQQKLLDHMHDGVVFVDSQLKIFLWNQGAERLSGITSNAAYQRPWSPSLVQMRDERGSIVPDDACPVATAIKIGVQSLQRLSIAGRDGQDAPIDLHAIPVVGRDGTNYGATLLLHDASSETTLEQRCQNLHSQATKDPMTQVANRAEFDRVHALFIQAHRESNLPCSLIICDIDHFKHVNDKYGHQAGDEAITSFASLLKSMCRHGDLVARYGGEEFVMLCADCNNATGAARAEEIRRALSELPHPMLGSKRITASFGVTENQPGDSPETMLRRADRALLEAKASGRNCVVQLGTGAEPGAPAKRRGWWPFHSVLPDALLQTRLETNVPLGVAIEKLRGFVADHQAQIISTSDEKVEMFIEGSKGSLMRRLSDRPVPFLLELNFSANCLPSLNPKRASSSENQGTKIQVIIRPKKDRDRRRAQSKEKARQLLSSLRSYLMAREESPEHEDPIARAKKVLAPMLRKKD